MSSKRHQDTISKGQATGTAVEYRRRKADLEEAQAMERVDAMLNECSAEIGAARERMAVRQVEIERLKAENRELLARTRRRLEGIEKAA
ncbi:MAG TPA: hypothetical protein VK582_03075 [Pyrinomonadaceae bacterium]|nr:hypothetical protein [Pyrinomonadaceae bacterium]